MEHVPETIIVGIVFYLLGFASGYFIKTKFENLRNDLNNSTIVLIAVTLIWAVSMIIDIVSSKYETSPYVHGLMGAIVGFFYKQNETSKKN